MHATGRAPCLEIRARQRVDLLAVKGDERIGIEIETGKSDAVANVKNCLLSEFSKNVVIATNDSALAKVERQLGEAGLLMVNRVDVVLRDALTGLAA